MLRHARRHPLCAVLMGDVTMSSDKFVEYRSELRKGSTASADPSWQLGAASCPLRQEAETLRARAALCRENAKEYSVTTAASLFTRALELEREAAWIESRFVGRGALFSKQ
jgi:hypothetical protein